VCDCVEAIMLWHEFGNPCFAFAFVVVAVVGNNMGMVKTTVFGSQGLQVWVQY
jgi:hypothetical protein